MANLIYPTAKKKFLDADIDLLVDNIKIVLVDGADYTYSAAHDALDDVPAGARVATSGNLAGKTTTGGVFDHTAPVTFSSVTGDVSEILIYYKDSGVESTSWLICYIDTATGLAVTPDGNNITWTPDSGANKVFAL